MGRPLSRPINFVRIVYINLQRETQIMIFTVVCATLAVCLWVFRPSQSPAQQAYQAIPVRITDPTSPLRR